MKLEDNRQGEHRALRSKSPSLLAGKVVDAAGEPLVSSHACKGQVRYRYYVSKALRYERDPKETGCRIPALELEKAVCEGVASEVRQPLALVDRAGLQPSPAELARLAGGAQLLADRLAKREQLTVRQLVEQVRVAIGAITVTLNAGNLLAALELEVPKDGAATLPITIPVSLKRSGRAMRLLQVDGRAIGSADPQEHLVRLIHRARSWWQDMLKHEQTPAASAREHGVTSSYVARLIRLNFLAPEIIESIVSGSQPAALDAKILLGLNELPLDWSGQKDSLLH